LFYTKIGNKKETDLPIRIVCATRETIGNFQETMLWKSVLICSTIFNVEIYVETENKNSLGKVYNEVIDISKENPAILVFVHDDILITDLFWNKTLRNELEKFDIVGLAGTTRRHTNQASWCMIDPELIQCEDEEYLSGIVAHGKKFPPKNIGVFGDVGKKCKLMDGLFLATYSKTLIENNLKFDERFNFHFYDLDFCRQAELLNLSMGTIAISVVHGSENTYDDNWKLMYNEYLKKWKN
jgi:hypothetical protein